VSSPGLVTADSFTPPAAFSRPTPPADCQRLVIVGAGGFGREVLRWACDAWPSHAGLVAGFLSDDPGRLRGHSTELPILESPETYVSRRGDYLLLAIGIPEARRAVAEGLRDRGCSFVSLVHPTAIVAPSASIGSGSILCPFSILSDAAAVGEFVLMNYHTSLGHDATAGDFSVLSPYATLGGSASIGPDVFLGLHASVGPGVSCGPRVKISSNSTALSNAPADAFVYGVPGRVGPRIDCGRRSPSPAAEQADA
jgi:sugar O-acyltransferase (sialic acid O-acetyltransferase NeuD family)